MRIVTAFGIAAAMLLCAANSSRADTCETFPGSQVYTDNCGATAQQPSQGTTSAVQSQSTSLRDQLRRALQSKNAPAPSAAQEKAIDAAEQRWADASARAQDATTRAQQTNDPALKAQLKQQYDAAMRDLHQAGADLIKADPQQKAKIEALLKDYDAQGAKAAAAAGLEAPAKAATTTPMSATSRSPAATTSRAGRLPRTVSNVPT